MLTMLKKIQFQFEGFESPKNDEQGMKHQEIDLHGLSTIYNDDFISSLHIVI
jgi:hypothetical protein